MRGKGRLSLVVVLVASLLPFHAAVAGSGDAGTGADAPDASADALLLSAYGSFGGTRSTNDRDWFRWSDDGAAGCLLLTFSSPGAHNVTLASQRSDGSTRATWMHVPASSDGTYVERRLALATRPAHAYAGIVPAPTKHHTTDYAFTLERFRAGDLGSGDAGSGTDAGDSLATALAATKPCLRGDLFDLNRIDTYAFTGRAGARLDVSVVGAVTLLVLDAAGNVLAKVVPGDAASVALPSDGTYYMQASSTDAVSYFLGWVVSSDSDPGQACRPSCVMS